MLSWYDYILWYHSSSPATKQDSLVSRPHSTHFFPSSSAVMHPGRCGYSIWCIPSLEKKALLCCGRRWRAGVKRRGNSDTTLEPQPELPFLDAHCLTEGSLPLPIWPVWGDDYAHQCPCPSSCGSGGSSLMSVSILMIAMQASTALLSCLTLLMLGSKTPIFTTSTTLPLIKSRP